MPRRREDPLVQPQYFVAAVKEQGSRRGRVVGQERPEVTVRRQTEWSIPLRVFQMGLGQLGVNTEGPFATETVPITDPRR